MRVFFCKFTLVFTLVFSPVSHGADSCSGSFAEEGPKKIIGFKYKAVPDFGSIKIPFSKKEPSEAYRDESIVFHYFDFLVRDKGESVALLLGNSASDTTQKHTTFAGVTIRELLAELAAQNNNFIYDADSSYAPIIQQVLGSKALGVSGRHNLPSWDPETRVVAIPNPYLRLKIFSSCDHILGTQDSFAVPALQLERRVVHVLEGGTSPHVDEAKSWLDQFHSWGSFSVRRDKVENLGIFSVGESYGISNLAHFLKILGTEKRFQKQHQEIIFSPPSFYAAKLSHSSRAGQYARLMRQGVRKITQDDRGQKIPGGAVLFGSSMGGVEYEKLIYDVSFFLGDLGITGATGGSGGYMETSNAGFFAAGAHSIGIHLSGGWAIDTEHLVGRHHTVTVGGGGYESRIPLLLHGRKIILVAPGGSGTMTELSTALMLMNSEAAEPRELVFLSSHYYGKLGHYLQNIAQFSTEVKRTQRINVIDGVEPLTGILRRLEADLGAARLGDLKLSKNHSVEEK